MIPTLPVTGASARTMMWFSKSTRTRSGCAAAIPASSSSTTVSGLLISFFIAEGLLSDTSWSGSLRSLFDVADMIRTLME